jgi:hypothetical protein
VASNQTAASPGKCLAASSQCLFPSLGSRCSVIISDIKSECKKHSVVFHTPIPKRDRSKLGIGMSGYETTSSPRSSTTHFPSSSKKNYRFLIDSRSESPLARKLCMHFPIDLNVSNYVTGTIIRLVLTDSMRIMRYRPGGIDKHTPQ